MAPTEISVAAIERSAASIGRSVAPVGRSVNPTAESRGLLLQMDGARVDTGSSSQLATAGDP